MKVPPFRAAIFDLDGTLLESLHVWADVDAKFLSKRGFAVPPDYQHAVKSLNMLEAAYYTIERFSLREKPEDLIAEWKQLIREAYTNEVTLRPFAKEYLYYLKGMGVKLAVATSSAPELYESALKRNGVYSCFSAFATTQESRGKHFPDVYFEAAKLLGVAPEDCIVFEDVLTAVTTAHDAGFYTVAVEEPTSLHLKAELLKNSDCYISSYEELMN